jgi:small subunit ribosomal protein S16
VAVKIRLKRMGKIRTPFYRIVVADSRTKRDGRVIEEIGTYNPKADPSVISVDSERAQYWLGVGAQPSEPVAVLLKLTGDWQKFRGESAPAEMLVAEPRRDKSDIFNEALKDSQNEPKSGAVTKKRSTRKPRAADEVVADAAPAEQVPAAEEPKPEEPEEPKPEEPAGDTPAEPSDPAELSDPAEPSAAPADQPKNEA